MIHSLLEGGHHENYGAQKDSDPGYPTNIT